MAALSEQDKKEIRDFFEENKSVDGVCASVEKSFREVVYEIWVQDDKIKRMQEEIEELKRENDRLKTNVDTDDMTKPQPCTKFCNAGAPVTMKWLTKLSEEMHEVIQEATDMEELLWLQEIWSAADTKDRLAMELTDVKTVCESWLHDLGYSEEARGDLQRRVNEKNHERGYF
jgi:hypothetical protein